MLPSIDWWLPTFWDNLSVSSSGGKTIQKRCRDWLVRGNIGNGVGGDLFFVVCMTVGDGTDRVFRNIVNYQSALRNNPEDQRTYLHHGGSLK